MGRNVKKLAEIAKSIKPLPIITLFHDSDADMLNEPS